MKQDRIKEDDFFEVVSGTFTEDFLEEGDSHQHDKDAKLTAVITIILTVAVAIAMGVLFLKGVDTIKTASQQSQSGVIVP
jgi:hypothetical protein